MHKMTTAAVGLLLAALLAATPVAAKSTADVSPDAPAMVEVAFVVGGHLNVMFAVELNSVPYTTMKACGVSLPKDKPKLYAWAQSHYPTTKAFMVQCVLRPKYMGDRVIIAE